MQRDLCKAKKKEKFPCHRYYRGKKIFQLVFLVGPPGGSSRVQWWCVQQQASASLREKRMTSSQQRRSSSWWLDSDFLEAFFHKTNSCVRKKKKNKLLKSCTKKGNQSEWVAPGQQNFWIDCWILITNYDVQNAHPTRFSPSSSLMRAKRMGSGCAGVCRDRNNFVQFVHLPLGHTSSTCTL
jgi:hypothetical protein